MRTTLLISLCGLGLATGGCSGSHFDPTPNQMMGAEDLNYPPGPYGYQTGSVVEDIVFLGKADPAGAAGSADYTTLPMKRVSLGDYHNDTTVKYVVLSGVAGWCGPCNNEQMYVPPLQKKYEPTGFRFFEAMIEGYNHTTGAPATENDVNTWASNHALHVGLGIDPEDKIHQFADVAAFPFNMVVRTSDMNIVYTFTGETNLDSVLAGLP